METVWVIPLGVAIAVAFSHTTKSITHYVREGKWSWRTLLWDTGGMPSSHSATVTALATSVLLIQGFSVAFWIALLFALVVIRDAFGVRRSVSDQAHLLNILTSRMNIEKKVKIVLGHTPLQVTAGMAVGVGAALLSQLIL